MPATDTAVPHANLDQGQTFTPLGAYPLAGHPPKRVTTSGMLE